jgi:hypothetical protein
VKKPQAALALALVVCARSAAASEAPVDEYAEARARADASGAVAPDAHPFAFVVDPATPAKGAVAFGYTLGLGSGVSAERPIPVVLQAAGVSHQLSLGYGLGSGLEPMGDVTVTTSSGQSTTSATLGMKLALFGDPASPWRAAVMGGGLREGRSSALGLWTRLVGSYAAGPLLVEANGYLESVFAQGRDAADYAVMLGASWRCLPWLRAGAEYVGQDLEELGASGAEGGARQAVGPNVAVDLDGGRYQVVAATLFGVGALSPTALVRVGLVGTF